MQISNRLGSKTMNIITRSCTKRNNDLQYGCSCCTIFHACIIGKLSIGKLKHFSENKWKKAFTGFSCNLLAYQTKAKEGKVRQTTGDLALSLLPKNIHFNYLHIKDIVKLQMQTMANLRIAKFVNFDPDGFGTPYIWKYLEYPSSKNIYNQFFEIYCFLFFKVGLCFSLAL